VPARIFPKITLGKIISCPPSARSSSKLTICDTVRCSSAARQILLATVSITPVSDRGEHRQVARLAAQVLNALRLVLPTQRPSPTCDDRHSALPPFIAIPSLHRRSRRCHVYYLHVT
jgi:hypothetical protein